MIGSSFEWYNCGKRLCNVKSLAVFMQLSVDEACQLASDFVFYDLKEVEDWFSTLRLDDNVYDDYDTSNAGVQQMAASLRDGGWSYTDYKQIQSEYNFCEYTYLKVIHALASLELDDVCDDIKSFLGCHNFVWQESQF